MNVLDQSAWPREYIEQKTNQINQLHEYVHVAAKTAQANA
jgi:hypothetical protein